MKWMYSIWRSLVRWRGGWGFRWLWSWLVWLCIGWRIFDIAKSVSYRAFNLTLLYFLRPKIALFSHGYFLEAYPTSWFIKVLLLMDQYLRSRLFLITSTKDPTPNLELSAQPASLVRHNLLIIYTIQSTTSRPRSPCHQPLIWSLSLLRGTLGHMCQRQVHRSTPMIDLSPLSLLLTSLVLAHVNLLLPCLLNFSLLLGCLEIRLEVPRLLAFDFLSLSFLW